MQGLRTPLLALAALLAGSCAGAAPDPAGGEPPDPAAPKAPPDTSVIPASDPEARRVGLVILECDNHLRTWTELMARPRDEENLKQLRLLEGSLTTLVKKHRQTLTDQALGGGARNRGIASAALGFGADASALPALLNNAASEDPEVASKALLGLGALHAPETPIAPIADAALRPGADPALVANAAFCLFQLAIVRKSDPDGAMGEVLVALLGNPDASVRAQSALALGLVRAVAALPALTDLLAGDESPTVRTAAAYALGQIGAQESSAPLIAALSDRDGVTAGAARAALTRIHGQDRGPRAEDWLTASQP